MNLANIFSRCMAIASLLLTSAPTWGAEAPRSDEFGAPLLDERSEGHRLYEQHCATCHDTGVARAPDPKMLRFLSPVTIHRALTEGVMRAQAAALSSNEKQMVAEYLTNRKLDSTLRQSKAPMCTGKAANFTWRNKPNAPNWGLTWGNTRNVSNRQAKLGVRNVANLKLKWAFAFPGAQRARSHPLLAWGAVFTGSQDGTVYALDQDSGCIRWTFAAGSEVRTGIVTDGSRSRGDSTPRRLYFGDLLGTIYAIDASNGQELWRAHPDDHPAATITAAPTVYQGRVYVSVSSLEVVSAIDDDYPCCKFRGSVVAYDAATGEKIWQTYSIAEAPSARARNSAGAQNYGPSGAPIWNSPAIDRKRGQLYVGTGENYSSPATLTSDSVIAMALETGAVRWSYQATHQDAWNSACSLRLHGANCPQEDGPDFDFGAAMVLARSSSGKELVIAGQKSSTVHAVDPDTGKLVWQTTLGRGGLHGGVHFGLAVSGDRVLVPISDAPDTRSYDTPPNPGLFALDLESGEVLWRAPMADECRGREYCAPGIGAAITSTPELVFAGALDGYLRIHDVRDGRLLRKIDTTQSVVSVSGTSASGGSMNGATAPVPYRGRLYVNSGYNFAGHMGGNVMLVYALK
ncbi:MAG: PQQ-binding-like beta-propeller repeat protein [Pseudomonadales bacterium]